jgi:hypothetical protein
MDMDAPECRGVGWIGARRVLLAAAQAFGEKLETVDCGGVPGTKRGNLVLRHG